MKYNPGDILYWSVWHPEKEIPILYELTIKQVNNKLYIIDMRDCVTGKINLGAAYTEDYLLQHASVTKEEAIEDTIKKLKASIADYTNKTNDKISKFKSLLKELTI